MNPEGIGHDTDRGSLQVSDEVIARVAGIAVLEEPGVVSLTTTLVGGITERLGRKAAYQGVRLTIADGCVDVELYVIVRFGSKIPELAQSVQRRVKSAVETMVGLTVNTVNVHIQGISFEHMDRMGHSNRAGESLAGIESASDKH